nr:MAG TPA: hypothetical protein [Caudoviricetes sp.]
MPLADFCNGNILHLRRAEQLILRIIRHSGGDLRCSVNDVHGRLDFFRSRPGIIAAVFERTELPAQIAQALDIEVVEQAAGNAALCHEHVHSVPDGGLRFAAPHAVDADVGQKAQRGTSPPPELRLCSILAAGGLRVKRGDGGAELRIGQLGCGYDAVAGKYRRLLLSKSKLREQRVKCPVCLIPIHLCVICFCSGEGSCSPRSPEKNPTKKQAAARIRRAPEIHRLSLGHAERKSSPCAVLVLVFGLDEGLALDRPIGVDYRAHALDEGGVTAVVRHFHKTHHSTRVQITVLVAREQVSGELYRLGGLATCQGQLFEVLLDFGNAGLRRVVISIRDVTSERDAALPVLAYEVMRALSFDFRSFEKLALHFQRRGERVAHLLLFGSKVGRRRFQQRENLVYRLGADAAVCGDFLLALRLCLRLVRLHLFGKFCQLLTAELADVDYIIIHIILFYKKLFFIFQFSEHSARILYRSAQKAHIAHMLYGVAESEVAERLFQAPAVPPHGRRINIYRTLYSLRVVHIFRVHHIFHTFHGLSSLHKLLSILSSFTFSGLIIKGSPPP